MASEEIGIETEVVLVQVSPGDNSLRHVRELVFEYTQYLLQYECDVGSFQDLEVELKELPGRYSREHGGALLVCYPSNSLYAQGLEAVHREAITCKDGALKDADAMACVALKALGTEGDCEIKRLFVREPYRKLGLGKLLTRVIIQQAKKLSSYERVKLDTLERLPHCIPMYTGMGFKACPPYVPNPLGDAVYLELPLPVKAPKGLAQVEDAANVLINARRTPQTAVPSVPVVSSVAEAYQIHSAIARSGEVIQGWKVGATNDAALKRLGLNAAFRGALYSPNVRRGPCSVAWEELGAKLSAIEVEFAFVMDKALPPRASPAYTEDEVWANVRCMLPAIEVAATRCPQAMPACAETIPQLIADYGLNGCLVLGKPISVTGMDWKILSDASATISREGGGKGISAEGKGSNVMGNPVTSLAWLASSLSRDGITLQEGAVVTTGAAALLSPDVCEWGKKCTIKATLGELPVEAGDCSISMELPEA